MAQRNYLVSTTALSLTASGTTIGSGNTQSATFVVAQTLVRTGVVADELLADSQTWSIHYVVSAVSHSTLEMRLKLQRRNSSGVMQTESGYTTSRNATGTYDDDLTWTSGTWADGDELALVWEHLKTSGGGNRSETIDTGGSSYVDAPEPASGITGTGATVAAAQVSASSGTVSIAGSAATSAATQTSAATGGVAITSTAATSATAQTSASTGSVAVSGTAATESTAQVSASSGTVAVSGSGATSSAPQASTAAGAVRITGTLHTVASAQVTAGTGTVQSDDPITGIGATVATAQVTAATGTVRITGTLHTAATAQTSSANGTVIIGGPMATTAAAQVSAASGTVASVGNATHTAVLEDCDYGWIAATRDETMEEIRDHVRALIGDATDAVAVTLRESMVDGYLSRNEDAQIERVNSWIRAVLES